MKTPFPKAWILLLGLLLGGGLNACVSVKAYEKMYLNDADMALKARTVEGFETDVQAYREGAAGANGGKVGGGCGCN